MNPTARSIPLLLLALALNAATPPVKRSDVVFMYQADRSVYARYGATVLAWGGTPTPHALEAAQGVTFFGSVGMVTEFARYCDRFPDRYEQGLCRDVDGRPVKVPWLTDHQHHGIPYWWCCTQQPVFRQYLTERVIETVKAGAHGVHIDDHLGTAGGLWLGLCFCERCVEGFRAHLQTIPADQRNTWGIDDPADFDFRAEVRRWLAADPRGGRKPTGHPLWPQWTIYQCRAAAAFVQELRDLATQAAGRAVPFGANAGLLWPRHLADYQSLDLFSAETDHHAADKRFPDLPLLAYRMADAVGRPYAATASGGDWAFVKEHNLPGLVRGWIALSYAAGHCLMAPHRQWCYTPEKGTHWYEGPADRFAPLYQFIRRNASWFDGYQAYADLAVVMPHQAFAANPGAWFEIANALAAANVSYRLLLGGDAIVDHPLDPGQFDAHQVLLVPERTSLLPRDRQILERQAVGKRVFESLTSALAAIRPAVKVDAAGPVRVLPRVKAGSAVVHLVNYRYRPEQDDVEPLATVGLTLDLAALGLSSSVQCTWITPEAPSKSLPLIGTRVEVPDLGLWGLLRFDAKP